MQGRWAPFFYRDRGCCCRGLRLASRMGTSQVPVKNPRIWQITLIRYCFLGVVRFG